MVRKTPMYGTPPGSLEEDLAEHHKPAAFSRIQVAALVRIGVAAFSRIARPLSTEFCTVAQLQRIGPVYGTAPPSCGGWWPHQGVLSPAAFPLSPWSVCF